MKLTFWGAARQVTGSMCLLEVDDFRLLIDCGVNFDLDEKQKKALYDQQRSVFPFDPTLVNTVLLTPAHIDHSGRLPQFVKEEFDAFLECGILAHGFLRLHCGDCGHDKLVAFSCKRRGFCPWCGVRRMA